VLARLLGRGRDDGDTPVAHAFAALRPLTTALERLTAPPGALVMAPVEIH